MLFHEHCFCVEKIDFTANVLPNQSWSVDICLSQTNPRCGKLNTLYLMRKRSETLLNKRNKMHETVAFSSGIYGIDIGNTI